MSQRKLLCAALAEATDLLCNRVLAHPSQTSLKSIKDLSDGMPKFGAD